MAAQKRGYLANNPHELSMLEEGEHALSRCGDPARGGETVVRLLVERDGRRTLRALDERCPERTVDAGNETDIRGVVVFVGNTV